MGIRSFAWGQKPPHVSFTCVQVGHMNSNWEETMGLYLLVNFHCSFTNVTLKPKLYIRFFLLILYASVCIQMNTQPFKVYSIWQHARMQHALQKVSSLSSICSIFHQKLWPITMSLYSYKLNLLQSHNPLTQALVKATTCPPFCCCSVSLVLFSTVKQWPGPVLPPCGRKFNFTKIKWCAYYSSDDICVTRTVHGPSHNV